MPTLPHACLPILLLAAASTGAAPTPAHASPPASCPPAQRAAVHLFLDIACTAPASHPGTLAACDAPHPHGRRLLGADLPVVACARRVAWVLALFGQIIRPWWSTPDYRWDTRRFDQVVSDARNGDVPFDDLPPTMRIGLVEAVRGTLRPDDGPVPHVSVTPASDPRMRQPVSAIAALGLETAVDRYLDPPSAAANAHRHYGPPPAVRMDVDSPASIGVYGWDLRRTWPEPGPPLRWRASPDGMAWQPDLAHSFTPQILDSRAAGAPQPFSDHPVLQYIVGQMDTWRLAPFTPYRDLGLPEEIRTLAGVARQQAANVREAARAPLATASVRHVYVIVRLAGGVEAVLHGSVGRFAPTVAEIHAIAVPARNVFPTLPLTPVTYRQAAVRGATAVAIRAFVNHVQGHGATMLAYIGQDLPAASPAQRTVPHDEP